MHSTDIQFIVRCQSLCHSMVTNAVKGTMNLKSLYGVAGIETPQPFNG